jgi:hypothetical protein
MTPQGLQSACIVAFPGARSGQGGVRRDGFRRFKAELHAFSERPSTESAIRYLAASRALRPRQAPLEHGDLPPAA